VAGVWRPGGRRRQGRGGCVRGVWEARLPSSCPSALRRGGAEQVAVLLLGGEGSLSAGLWETQALPLPPSAGGLTVSSLRNPGCAAVFIGTVCEVTSLVSVEVEVFVEVLPASEACLELSVYECVVFLL